MKKRFQNISNLVSVFLLLVVFLNFDAPLNVFASGYGEDAYTYLQEIDENYPGREASMPNNDALAEYIMEKMSGFGYQVTTQDFSLEGHSGTNLIYTKQGDTPYELVLCAHYDSDPETNGAEDNGSGVALLLELADRLTSVSTPCSLRIIFFDVEEYGCFGSYFYIDEFGLENIVGVINIDCIAGGDVMYVHAGGTYVDGPVVATTTDVIQAAALQVSEELELPITTHPETSDTPAGTRAYGSDHMHFARLGIPYLYLEASLYADGYGDTRPNHVQTADPRVVGGQIMHSEYDNLSVIEELFPGRALEHLNGYCRMVMNLVQRLQPDLTLSDVEVIMEEETAEIETSEEQSTSEAEIQDETEQFSGDETEENAVSQSEAEPQSLAQATDPEINSTEGEAGNETGASIRGKLPYLIGGIAAVLAGLAILVISFRKRK